jgi:hypothetical protein
MEVHTLCRKIGIRNVRSRLLDIIARARRWFAYHDGELKPKIHENRAEFSIADPHIRPQQKPHKMRVSEPEGEMPPRAPKNYRPVKQRKQFRKHRNAPSENTMHDKTETMQREKLGTWASDEDGRRFRIDPETGEDM